MRPVRNVPVSAWEAFHSGLMKMKTLSLKFILALGVLSLLPLDCTPMRARVSGLVTNYPLMETRAAGV